MARRQFTPAVVSRGRKIDFKQWSAAPGLIFSSAAAGILIGGSLAFTFPATILRWRGVVTAMFDETAVAGDQVKLTYGIGVFNTASVTAISLPLPAADTDYPWVWWNQMFLQQKGTGDEHAWGANNQKLEIDSKAMRKIKPEESLLLIVDRTNLVGAPVVEHFLGQLRVLIGT